MTDKFFIYLNTNEIYVMHLNHNFKYYKIKNECLYQGFRKLGKIIGIEGVENDE